MSYAYHARKESNLLKLRSKNFYRYVNNRLKSRKSFPAMHDKIDSLILDDETKAKGFLNEFKMAFTLDNGLSPSFPDKGCSFDAKSIDFSPINVKKYLKKFNSSSAAGPDGLPGILLTSLANSLCTPLSIIFCKSFNSGQLPDMWKKSFITPVFKKGDPSKFCNYTSCNHLYHMSCHGVNHKDSND